MHQGNHNLKAPTTWKHPRMLQLVLDFHISIWLNSRALKKTFCFTYYIVNYLSSSQITLTLVVSCAMGHTNVNPGLQRAQSDSNKRKALDFEGRSSTRVFIVRLQRYSLGDFEGGNGCGSNKGWIYTLINKSDIINIPDSLQDRQTLSQGDMIQK